MRVEVFAVAREVFILTQVDLSDFETVRATASKVQDIKLDHTSAPVVQRVSHLAHKLP